MRPSSSGRIAQRIDWDNREISMELAKWTHKIKRYSIRARWYWYETTDGGFTWNRISAAQAMRIIDANSGVALD